MIRSPQKNSHGCSYNCFIQKKIPYLFRQFTFKTAIMEYDKNNEIYSKVVRAGKRTYFFDVKSTKGNDLYLTMTESKKTYIDGRETYQKHKVFLYKEDFEKFEDGLKDVLNKIQELNESGDFVTTNKSEKENYSEVSFEDL